jgi:hypothetical protein
MKLLFLFSIFICLNCYKISDPLKKIKAEAKVEPGKIRIGKAKVDEEPGKIIIGKIKIKEDLGPKVKGGVSANATSFNNYTKIRDKWGPIGIGRCVGIGRLSNISRLAIGSKPVIYLYPEEPMDISVNLNPRNNIFTTIYPKFNGENTWNVHAEPNGDITIKGRKYPYLFWEALLYDNQDLSEGFIVKAEDAENFLEEKLSILGLNDKEKTDFITYWLPLLLRNKLSLCSFQKHEFFNSIELNITPKPDSLIRIFLSIKKIDAPINIKEQKLQSIERKGFTVIEWGGSDLNKKY